MLIPVLTSALVLVAFVIIFRRVTYAKLPPGPPQWPWIGNLLIFPRSRLHLAFTEWGILS
jgi:hypothetical protein